MAIKICPECGGKVAGSRNDCPRCGYKFADTANKVKCPECEEFVIPGADGTCPVCGHEFEMTFGGTPAPNPIPILQDDPLELFEWEEIPGGDIKITKFRNQYANEIVIPEGKRVVVIGKGAFKGLLYLEKITIPNSVRIIEDEAFADCPKLEIELPKGIHIGKNVISGTKTEIRKTREEAERKAREERYKVGKIIEFGSYPQEKDGTRKAISWVILERKDNKILLISDKGLDCKQYNNEYCDITWETCSLRKWLNSTFLNDAFSTKEQEKIQSTKVTADKNPQYDTNPGNDTTDKVFLLSITEAEKYFSSDEDRKCVPTAYAKNQGAYTNNDYKKGGAATCWWWLRSPGYDQNYAAYVNDGGSVLYFGFFVNFANDCVRPALWVNLES